MFARDRHAARETYDDYNEYEEDEDDQEEEEEQEAEEEKPSKEVMDFLKLREKLKEKIRQKCKKENAAVAGPAHSLAKNGTTTDSNYVLLSDNYLCVDPRKLDKMDTLSGKKKSKKRTKPDPAGDFSVKKDADIEVMDDPDCEFDMNEPTMGEKLASLSLLSDVKSNDTSKGENFPEIKPPSADSVYILLKQALHAEDHALLLNCLYTRDEKVITNSISMLNPSDVLRLLDSLISMIHSRGAVLICCLPWLRSLLVQHASSIISQESSLSTLNSLYQLIDSRISTFGSALQLSTCLDNVFAGIPDDEADEHDVVPPVIYEDKDSTDEEADDVMGSDDENEELGAVIDSLHGSEGRVIS